MAWNLTLASLTNALGGVALVALGLWVLTLRPRLRTNVALALMAGGFGFGWMFHYSLPTPDEPLLEVWTALSTGGFLVGALGAVLMALWFPWRLTAADRGGIGVALGVAGAFLVVALAAQAGGVTSPFSPPARTGLPLVETAWVVAINVLQASWWFALVLFAHRFRVAPPGASAERRQLALVSAAMLVYVAFLDAVFFTAPIGPLRVQGGAGLTVVIALSFLWLRNVRGPDSTLARHVTLWGLAVALAGALWTVALGGFTVANASPAWGVLRLVSMGLLVYAIVRHQLLGFDVKVRWTISKTSVAAVFVAVFFVASEAAQAFFGERTGSQYVGILAAGALVFAIAPLSRLADRMAERAVPVATGAGRQDDRAAAIYRAALRAALADGAMTAAEEEHLAEVQGHLELAPLAALRLRREVEAEREGGVA